MSGNRASDQRRGGRGTVEARRRRGMRPTLMALEDRRLLSTFTVTNTADSGTGSLPWAIGQANLTGGAETITFDPTAFASAQTITLTGGRLELSDTSGTETITGPAAGVTVSGGGTSQVFQVDSGVTAEIDGLTVTGGNGGAISNFGTLTLTNSTLSDNSASVGAGGIYNDNFGTLTLTNSTLSDNSVIHGAGGIDNETTATLTTSTLSDNSASDGAGGGISNDGTLTLTNSTLSDNSALRGGGIYNHGTATLNNTIVAKSSPSGGDVVNDGTLNGSNNLIETAITGGGTNLLAGTLTGDPLLAPLADYGGPTQTMALLPGSPALRAGTTNSGVSTDQRGFPLDSPPDIGAFQAQSGPLVVNTTVDGLGSPSGDLSLREAVNLVDANSAHIITFDPTVFASAQTITLTSGQLELSNTYGVATITGPAAGVTVSGGGTSRVFQVDPGVLANLSVLTISGGSTTGNGGGLYNGGITTLTDSTLSGNEASGYGGAIFTDGADLYLNNCTLAKNTAGVSGGAIEAQGTVLVTRSTFSANQATSSGGAIDNAYGQYTVKIGDSILAGDSCGFGPEVSNAVVSLGHNLVGEIDDSSGWVGSDLTGTVAQPLDPLLAPLGNYGGPTQTMALLPGSPAIDAGSNALPAGVTTDQRGPGYPRIVNGTVDIGAFESSGFTIAVTSGSGKSANITEPFANPLVVTVTANNSIEPVAGGQVRFTAPTSGASASLSVNPATIAADGMASTTPTANASAGSYAVTATATGVTNPASFSLTNVASLVVNTTSDSAYTAPGVNTLRLAITYANSFTTGTPTITFDPNVFASAQTITLTSGQLELSNTVETEVITGPAAGVTVSGGGLSQVFQVDTGVTAEIGGLTVTGGNAGGGGGGAIANVGTLTLNNSTLSGNSAGGGGGAIANVGTLTLTNSTLSGNSAGVGGAIANAGTLTLINSTLSDNSAPSGGDGGGIFNDGTATLTNCTVSGNSAGNEGGGVYNYYNNAPVTIGNTIVAGNTTDGYGPDVEGPFASQGNNLIGKTDTSSGWVGSDLTGTIAKPLNPLLAPLGNYGGPTQTMALLPGSPAIDAGVAVAGVTTDQRGIPRPQGSAPDIGAFESRGFTMAITGGNGQSTTVNTGFLNPLAVTVTSPYGEPVQGGVVTFTAPGGGAGATFPASSSTSATATINPVGQAAVAATANKVAGSYAVMATASGATFAAGFSLTNTPGVPVSITATAGTGQSTTVGYAFATPLQVTVTDQYHNPVPGVFVVFAAPTSGPSGTFSGGAAVTTDAHGIAAATFNANTVAGSYAVTATASGLAGSPVSFNLTNTADVASSFVVSGFPSPTTAGTAYGFSVTARDRYGNVATGYAGTVHFTSSDPHAALPADSNLTSGIGSFSSATLETAGSQSITATDSATASITGTESGITVTPAAASQLVITRQPSATATAGAAFSTQPVVKEEDQFGNVVTSDSTNTVTARDGVGTASLQGTTTMTLSSGVARFSGLSYNKAETMDIFFTTTAGVFSATSNNVVVSPAAASQLVITQQPSAAATVGAAFTTQPVIYKEDQFGNLETADNTTVVTAALNSGTGPLQGTTTATVSGGVATFTNLADDTAETMNIAFTTNASGVSSATSSNVVVSPATASQLVITQQAWSTATAGVAFTTQPVVAEEDQFGNVETGDSTHTVTAASTGTASLLGTATVTLVNGVATFSGLSYIKAETIALNFTTNAGSFSATSSNVVVSPAATSKLVIHTQPSSTATAGVAFGTQPVIYEEDQFGNLETADNTTVMTAALNSGTGPLQGTTTATVSGGVATFTNLADDKAETISLKFTANAGSFSAT